MSGIVSLCLLSLQGTPASASIGVVTHTSICAIQGKWFTSPYENKTVTTQGVVYAGLESRQKGFYMQAVNCDADLQTSDGIFVYLGDASEVVQPGDLVEVSGVVQEYYNMTEINASPDNIKVLSNGNSLPAPVELNPPFDEQEASKYYESLEGMYVAMGDAAVVGPTSSVGETWVVRTDLGIARVFQNDPRGTGEILCVDEGGLYRITPEARVGDQVLDLEGALKYSYGVYRLLLIEMPSLVQGELPQEPRSELDSRLGSHKDAFDFTMATFNLANLFDTYDDPYTEDSVLSAAEYQRRIKKRALAIHSQLNEPAILAVQEAENQTVLQDLVASPEIGSEYAILWEDGPDFRGIDIALLYRTDLVELLDYEQIQGCTSLLDGLGPDGNRDVIDPQNAITCDTDSDGHPDGNRLFSRPPLVAQMKICPSGCSLDMEDDGDAFVLNVMVNHWKSKLQDGVITQYTLPRRLEQAQFVADKVLQMREEEPGSSIILLGDLNDFPGSEPLTLLNDAGLLDLTDYIPESGRYTFIYQGVSQVLDYALYLPTPWLKPTSHTSLHFNADYPAVYAGVEENYYRSSDHDPLVTTFTRPDQFSFLPLLSSGE
jgi:predicted extracellular nuclease